MIKFFRKIRQQMLNENKFSKYLLYAIGEIVLVVIGILIALQINNWNSKRIDSNRVLQYYERMHQELEDTKLSSIRFHAGIDELLQMNRRSLTLLNTKNKDSLQRLSETLGALATGYSNSFSFPIIEEFLNQDYLAKIPNDSIKFHLQNFSRFLTISKSHDDYIFNQYRTVIEPFFNENINYQEVAVPAQKKNLIPGGPATDFVRFSNNLKLWNILSFKVEVLAEQKTELNQLLALMEVLDKELLKELEGNTK